MLYHLLSSVDLGRVVTRFSSPGLRKHGNWTIIFGKFSWWHVEHEILFLLLLIFFCGFWRGRRWFTACWFGSFHEEKFDYEFQESLSIPLDEFKARFRMRKATCEILLGEILTSGQILIQKHEGHWSEQSLRNLHCRYNPPFFILSCKDVEHGTSEICNFGWNEGRWIPVNVFLLFTTSFHDWIVPFDISSEKKKGFQYKW